MLTPLLVGDRIDHEVRRVADIGERAHEDRAHRDRRQRAGKRPHQLLWHRRRRARRTPDRSAHCRESRRGCRSARNRPPRAACRLARVTACSRKAKLPSRPACSIASTGMMPTKMPANRMATSRIGSQVKPLASRCSSGVSQSESERDEHQRGIAQRRSATRPWCRRCRRRCRASRCADTRIAAMMSGDQREIDRRPRTRDRRPAVRGRRSWSRCAKARVSSAKKIASTSTATISVCSQRCCAVQKKSTPRRKPTNSGGSPSGVSAPPILATRKMKKTTTCALCARAGVGADQRPDQDHGGAGGADELAMAVPKARIATLVARRAAQIAGDQDAAGDDVEREQQHDEAQIFGERGVHEGGQAAVRAEAARDRQRASAAPRRMRSCRSGGARLRETAAGRRRSTAGCRRTAAPRARPSARRRARGAACAAGGARTQAATAKAGSMLFCCDRACRLPIKRCRPSNRANCVHRLRCGRMTDR